MHMGINVFDERQPVGVIGQKSKLCAGDAQARYLAWKMKKVKNGTT